MTTLPKPSTPGPDDSYSPVDSHATRVSTWCVHLIKFPRKWRFKKMALLPPRSSFHPVPIGKLRPFHPAYTLLGRRSASHDTRFVAPAMKYHVEASSFESLAELQQTLGEARHLFFAHTLCPYAERVWLAFEETGKEAALVHVDLSKKPAWFREVSPNMLVPTVLHDGKVHVESMDILQWLLNDTVRSTSTISECVAACLDACGGNAGSWRVGSSISQRQVDALEHALKRTLSPRYAARREASGLSLHIPDHGRFDGRLRRRHTHPLRRCRRRLDPGDDASPQLYGHLCEPRALWKGDERSWPRLLRLSDYEHLRVSLASGGKPCLTQGGLLPEK